MEHFPVAIPHYEWSTGDSYDVDSIMILDIGDEPEALIRSQYEANTLDSRSDLVPIAWGSLDWPVIRRRGMEKYDWNRYKYFIRIPDGTVYSHVVISLRGKELSRDNKYLYAEWCDIMKLESV